LPIEVSYYATNVAVLDNAGNVVSVPLDKARAPKYVAAHLRTWDTVTFQGMTIPRHFECITYAPWPRPETKGIGCIVRGNATNVCSLIPFPTLPATLHLQDNRVSEAAVVYKVTDGKVPALETDFMTNARAKGLKLIENPLHVKNPEPDCNKTTTILGTWFWDVESNHLGGDSEIGGSKTDFWWQRDADGGAYLVPVNGAKAAIVEGQEFERIDSEYVRHVALSDEKIASGALKPGAILVFRTAEGRVGKFQVVGYKALHEFDFPEASYLTEGWRRYALSQPNERAYHLQVRCTVFK
jgi:hypothetical protein